MEEGEQNDAVLHPGGVYGARPSAMTGSVIGYIVFGVAATGAVALLAYWMFARAAEHRSRGGRRW